MAIEDIRDLVALSGHLATAGQPSEKQVLELAQAGFEVIVNLGLLDPRYCLADEAGLASSLGMTYHHIPVDFKAPQLQDLETFVSVMNGSRDKKVFVHCAANYRVSVFMALYGQAMLGWSASQADAHIRRVWEPNDTWSTFVEQSRLAFSRSTEMDALQEQDVPYGNDWDSAAEAAAYGDAADQQRPWRSKIRDHIADRIAMLRPRARVLELGSGPGLLADRVLQRCPHLETYTLLDFSEPMLALSRERLAAFPAVSFVLGSFKSEDWTDRVGAPFDCVVSMQAVHELRHKRHARRLYEQVYQVLAIPGLILVCDHTPFDDSPRNIALYMTEQEQQRALVDARFVNVHVELAVNGLMLYAGERTA